MEKRYDKLVESVGFLKHPISNVLYRAIAAESTSIVIETPTDYQIQKKNTILVKAKSCGQISL
ncbi:hypothetical protein DDB_G0271746 [Dictyostelium discoideum AX4]|uniref:hypothetical protein n=1 Tax=Dictyostelium discoideum AX4 TaxID=352472 RepID=UPI00004E4CC0|nr:hypothetical protein DDB_G0292512 [Dictyostelium discoideum AX4]XP_645451.1 hypothetical protein DDB_G0271746 [Dictyostelium discoideum AX4]EAL61235.1 hypothetical protein DDB_G0292512 [Dictyostelium discoideum AX4]EAL71563.1 hypothetical protein DDB_G0271746 [Dictyostelium discoideum AX4]|eukprot:XP_629649.1 hypothetical protein DDB_G0292512 [Dictyostelium discoideum AX4]